MLKNAPQLNVEKRDENRRMVSVPKADLVEAWKLLEAMTVSMATIGRCFLQPSSGPMDEDVYREMLDAVDDYLSAELVERFNKARFLIGDLLPRADIERMAEEAEGLADLDERMDQRAVPYWTYEGFEERRAKQFEERRADCPRRPQKRDLEE